MSETEFDKLLSYLHADDNQAAINFKQLRDQLIFYFQKRKCWDAEDKADEVLTRVAAKLAQERILDIRKYCYGVALRVLQEHWRQQAKANISLDELRPSQEPSVDPNDEERIYEEARNQSRSEECMQKCLQALSQEKRDLVILYCGAKDKEKVGKGLGIEITVLRVKIHRIRKELKNCRADCLRSHKDG